MAASLFTNTGTRIDTKQNLKADSYGELKEKINTRLGRKYTKSKVGFVWKVQALFDDPDFIELENGNFEEDHWKLKKALSFTIEQKANWYEYRYRNARLSYHDFEAELWKITFAAIEYYEDGGDFESYEGAEFTLIETLELFWKTRMIDFIRSCMYTEKHTPWYTAASLADDFNEFWPDSSPNPEQQLVINETITEMFTDSGLTKRERKLLEIIYDKPNDSLSKWGKLLNIEHPETVRRLYQPLKGKLAKYNPY